MSEKLEGNPSPQERKPLEYLWTSEQLLAPEVGAVQLGELEIGKYQELRSKMIKEAERRGIKNPLLVVDLIFKESKVSEFGSKGQPYPITEAEWEAFVNDIPEFNGDKIPKVYMVDGEKYTAPI